MEAGFVALFIVVIVVSVVLGMFIEKHRSKRLSDRTVQGDLNVHYDPEYGHQMYLQISVPVESIIDQKQVTFNVRTFQLNSQK